MNQPIRINPRVWDLSRRHHMAPLPKPKSDRELVERLRSDPAQHFDRPMPARGLPKGVIP